MGGIGLVLSGGGARGAFEAGVLGYVFCDLARRERRTPPLSIIAGTSVGAVNGAFVASRAHDLERSVARLEALWSDLELDDVLDFSLKHAIGLPRVLLGGNEGQGLFDAAALRKLAQDEVDWARLDQNLSRGVLQALTITATHVTTGRPVVFVQRAPDTALPLGLRTRAVVRESRIRVEHVLASAAIPLVFPSVDIDGYLHCDGGLRLNTPMAPAIHCGADRLLVIGVSTPAHAGGATLAPGKHPGAPFLLGKVLNAFLLDHLNADIAELDRINAVLRHGTELHGERFVAEMNHLAARDKTHPQRIVDYVAIRPAVDIGRIAAEQLRVRGRKMRGGLGKVLLRALDVGEGADADLASYLLFDGDFARALIDLGRQCAHERRDELAEFLFHR